MSVSIPKSGRSELVELMTKSSSPEPSTRLTLTFSSTWVVPQI